LRKSRTSPEIGAEPVNMSLTLPPRKALIFEKIIAS